MHIGIMVNRRNTHDRPPPTHVPIFSLPFESDMGGGGGEAWTNFSPASTSRMALSLPTLPYMHRHICVLSEKRPPAHSEPPAAGPGRNGFGFSPSPLFPQEARISPARR